MLQKYNEINEDVMSFTKLISILNTPIHELKNILNEYESVFSNVESIIDFIEWIEKNDG